MRTLIFNSNNVLPNTNNSVYRFNFPASVKFHRGDKIAIQSITFPYSFQNLNKLYYQNTTIQIIYNNQTTNITLPDGFYLVSDISNYIQQQCLLSTNNLPYQTNSSGQNSFYFELITNTTYYSTELIIYPAILKSGYTNPKNCVYTGLTPQININSNISKIIGINQDIYPLNPQNSIYIIQSYQQNNIPNATPVNSIVIQCNIINNDYDIASKTLYSFSPSVQYGSNIVISPSAFAFINIIESTQAFLDLIFTDQNYKQMAILDPNICIQVLIKSFDE